MPGGLLGAGDHESGRGRADQSRTAAASSSRTSLSVSTYLRLPYFTSTANSSIAIRRSSDVTLACLLVESATHYPVHHVHPERRAAGDRPCKADAPPQVARRPSVSLLPAEGAGRGQIVER